MKLSRPHLQTCRPVSRTPSPRSHAAFRVSRFARRLSARAFSLVEVLLAIFILGIGMIMVASVFPVGANWTRQTTESSICQTVAQNAQTVLRTHYGNNGDLHSFLYPEFFDPSGIATNTFIPLGSNSVLRANGALPNPPSPFVLQAFPGFVNIPPYERAYQFGNAAPFPAKDPAACTYFWTALIRLNPSHRGGVLATNFVQPASSYKYDVYILVFRKGALEHHFSATPPLPPATVYAEIPGMRNPLDTIVDESLIPSVGYATWTKGLYNPSRSPSVYDAMPPVGQYGIGAYSGTVFRQVLDPVTFDKASPRPFLKDQLLNSDTTESIIYSPAADGTANSSSPLIYIYQTTMSF